MALEQHCTLLIHLKDVKSAATEIDEIKASLESNDVAAKCRALKQAILLMLNGEDVSELMMIVIRYCVNTNDHQLIKHMQLYWEAVPKYDAKGNLLAEMILVCNALMKNLMHANEYICGCTLRFLAKLQEPEVLEPLVPSIKQSMKHRHAYARGNAVLTLYSIYKNFPDLCQDAPDLIENFLHAEMDVQARRNAFLMLFQADAPRAVAFLTENIEQVDKFGDGFQLAVLEIARKVCRQDPGQKSRFVRCIFELLQSDSALVSYDAASTLVALSNSPTAIRAAASTFCQLLTKHSDNNVKLIVLQRLDSLRQRHTKVLQELVVDILRALASPNREIRRRTLDIAIDLLSPRNIDGVMLILKKELMASQNENEESEQSAADYRAMLVKAIHQCAVKFPEVAGSVVNLMIEVLSGAGDGALPIVQFVREIVQAYPELRAGILEKLIDLLPFVSNTQVAEVVIWIVGEYCETMETISSAFSAVQEGLGPLPFTKHMPGDGAAPPSNEPGEIAGAGGPKLLADGTYASQSSMEQQQAQQAAAGEESKEDLPQLRQMLVLKGDVFLCGALAAALTKMTMRAFNALGDDSDPAKQMAVQVLLLICGMMELGNAPFLSHAMTKSTSERLRACLRILLDPEVRKDLDGVWLKECRASFDMLLQQRLQLEDRKKEEAKDSLAEMVGPDCLINFRQLRNRAELTGDVDLDDDLDLIRATGVEGKIDLSSRLNRVHQLTGFADPVYAEAFITVHDYDIVLEITVINRTDRRLTNLAVELATMGDLKIVERPQNFTIEPTSSQEIKASIKVASTETGHVFGNIVYNVDGQSEKVIVNLNDIHVDIMDYINPAICTTDEFRKMWAEFEWENKVAVNTTITDVSVFLKHIQSITNMRCLTPGAALSGNCNFLAANLYAKSVFGEDALVNVSVEKRGESKLVGYMRIRSKTQGIALSLGDRIQAKQRTEEKAS